MYFYLELMRLLVKVYNTNLKTIKLHFEILQFEYYITF